MQNISALIPRPALRSALGVLAKVTEKRNTIPILSNAAVFQAPDGFKLRATDMDIQATVTIPDAIADDGFALTLPTHVFQDIEKKAPATDHVALDAQSAALTTLDFEGLRAKVQSLPIADFPEMLVEGEIKADFELDTKHVREALEAVDLAISTEETRYYLNGVYLHITRDGTLRFVATDGHKLARFESREYDGDITASLGSIIPRRTVAFLLGLCKAKGTPARVRFQVNTAKIRITIGHVDIISKLVDGSFPDYQRVIPAGNDKVLRIEREAFAKAIKAVSCISSERGRAFKLSLSGGAVSEGMARLSVSNPDAGTTEMDVPAEWTQPDMDIGFNAAYVLEILDSLSGEVVTLKLADPGAPVLLSGSDDALLYVLMPMRV
jgi:DNA polymerase-3 subunit beta